MKRIYNKDFRLESHRLFPYIAWIVVITFSWFVYGLVLDLRAKADELHEKSQTLQTKTEIPVEQIKDFNQ